MIDYTNIVAIDLERACWEDKRPGEIIQIGLACIDLKTGEITKTRSDFVKPETDEISSFCTQLTGISQQRINKTGRPLSAVLDSIYTKIGSNKVYLAWGEDMLVIRRECEAKNIEFKFHTTLDLSLLFHMHQMFKNPKLSKKMGLERALEGYGVPFEGKQHNAEVDAINTAKLAHIFFKDTGLIPTETPVKSLKI